MGFFEKKVMIYEKKDRETWEKIRAALKEEGIPHVHAGRYFNEAVGTDGISGLLDPRDFGAKGKIDRNIYYVEVPESQADAAKKALLKHGLVAAVDPEARVDAARWKPGEDD